jgi:RNA polymerase sigma factor (sigma-70 family)
MQTAFDDSVALRLARSYAAQLIGHYGFGSDDFGDLTQELLHECIRRREKFNPSRSGLITFTKLVIRNRVASLIESRSAKRRDYRLCQPIEPKNSLAATRSGITSSGIELINLQIDVAKTVGTLRPDLARLAYHLGIHTISEIARITGQSRCTIYRKRTELRRIFENAGLGCYYPQAGRNQRPRTNGA